MCLNEYPVSTHGDTCFSYSLYQLRHSTGYSTGLVGLLQGMGDIQNNRITE